MLFFAVQGEKCGLVWCNSIGFTIVALKLAWGEARGKECIQAETRPTEQRSPRPISAQPSGRRRARKESLQQNENEQQQAHRDPQPPRIQAPVEHEGGLDRAED